MMDNKNRFSLPTRSGWVFDMSILKRDAPPGMSVRDAGKKTYICRSGFQLPPRNGQHAGMTTGFVNTEYRTPNKRMSNNE